MTERKGEKRVPQRRFVNSLFPPKEEKREKQRGKGCSRPRTRNQLVDTRLLEGHILGYRSARDERPSLVMTPSSGELAAASKRRRPEAVETEDQAPF